jgi:nitrite reductase/ring-hydroxylating ferredoxin subunit
MVRRRRLLTGFVPIVTLVSTSYGYVVRPLSRARRRQFSCVALPQATRISWTVLCASKRKVDPLEDIDPDKETARSKAGEILQSVSSKLAFGANEPKRRQPERREEEGVFKQIFRRKSEPSDEKKLEAGSERAKDEKSGQFRLPFPNFFGIGAKSENITDKDKESREKRSKQTKSSSQSGNKSPQGKVESDENKALAQIQGFFTFGKPSDEKEPKKPDESSSNPLSTIQKLFGLPRSDPFGKTAEKEDWYPVFPKTRIMPGEIKPVTVRGLDLLVVASTDNKSLYCIANSCPHLGTPLETGRLTRMPTEAKSSLASSTEPTGLKTNLTGMLLSETDVSNILSQDGCEDCIVCPLHHTAFALKSGEVRGEWCPYPPVLGAIMGTVKPKTSAAVFDVRTRGKNVEVRLNSLLLPDDASANPKGKSM